MSIKDSFLAYKTRLGSIGTNEPLTKFSFFLVLLLDIFIFSMITTGIEENTKTITTPESYASYQCQNIIYDIRDKNPDIGIRSVIEKLENYYSYDYNRSSSYGDSTDVWYVGIQGNAEWCRELDKRFSSAVGSAQTLITSLRDTETSIQGSESEKSTLNNSYQTTLLEKIAGQTRDKALTTESADTTKAKIALVDQKITSLRSEKEAKTTEIRNLSAVKDIFATVERYGGTVITTYESLVFWYPVKTFGAQILFVIPLLIITLFWSHASIRRNNGIQMLISTHLLGILAIFILLKILELIYDILPHKLIANVLAFLESWNIIGLWYYVMILLGIACTMRIIYIVQKKIFSKERLQAKHADKKECVECGSKLYEDARYCIRCGVDQYIKCPHCLGNTNVTAKYCMHCSKTI